MHFNLQRSVALWTFPLLTHIRHPRGSDVLAQRQSRFLSFLPQFQHNHACQPWTKEEVMALAEAVKNQSKGTTAVSWSIVAEEHGRLYNRTSLSLKARWLRLRNRRSSPNESKLTEEGDAGGFVRKTRKSYSAAEDEKIRQAVAEAQLREEMVNWAALGRALGRNGDGVSTRWMNILDPTIKRGVWTETELELLQCLVETAVSCNCWLKWRCLGPKLGRGERDVRRKMYNILKKLVAKQ